MDAAALLRPHADRVFSLALRLLGDRDEAADVTQDVLVRLWQHARELPDERRTAWTLRVTRNACLDAIRARRVRAAVALDDAPEPAGHDPSPTDEAEAADLRPHLNAALDSLGEPFKSIVVLREVEGYAYNEIADALELPLTTVKVYLHRARQRLRDILRVRLPAEALPLAARAVSA
jgi:RNA polymerase sigma-70 factor (ECF subfamily)